jgi:hypothetical protein
MESILTPRSVRLALTYDIDPRMGLIRLSRTHHPTFAEWSGFLESVLMDPAFEPGLSILDDRREDRLAPPRAEAEAAAAWLRANAERLGPIRWAIVLEPSAQAAYGMARAAELLADNSGVEWRVFTDLRTATEWATSTSSSL